MASLAVLALFWALRLAAAGCAGSGCDLYIPFSLLLPVLALLAAALTGVLGLVRTRGRRPWFSAFAAGLALSGGGPILALIVFRDRPDTLVPLATVLLAVEPVLALTFSLAPAGRRPPIS